MKHLFSASIIAASLLCAPSSKAQNAQMPLYFKNCIEPANPADKQTTAAACENASQRADNSRYEVDAEEAAMEVRNGKDRMITEAEWEQLQEKRKPFYYYSGMAKAKLLKIMETMDQGKSDRVCFIAKAARDELNSAMDVPGRSRGVALSNVRKVDAACTEAAGKAQADLSTITPSLDLNSDVPELATCLGQISAQNIFTVLKNCDEAKRKIDHINTKQTLKNNLILTPITTNARFTIGRIFLRQGEIQRALAQKNIKTFCKSIVSANYYFSISDKTPAQGSQDAVYMQTAKKFADRCEMSGY